VDTTTTAAYPYGASAITDQLLIAPRPHARHVESLRGLKVDLVVSMIGVTPPPELTRPPFKLLRLPVFDFPLLPIPLSVLWAGVNAAVPVLRNGGRVLIYCRAGRHRSVAMAACILIAMGMTADEAMSTIIVHRPVADPHARHIESRVRAFERDWLAKQAPAPRT
jgi:protein-tyrosine phosphatase